MAMLEEGGEGWEGWTNSNHYTVAVLDVTTEITKRLAPVKKMIVGI